MPDAEADEVVRDSTGSESDDAVDDHGDRETAEKAGVDHDDDAGDDGCSDDVG